MIYSGSNNCRQRVARVEAIGPMLTLINITAGHWNKTDKINNISTCTYICVAYFSGTGPHI